MDRINTDAVAIKVSNVKKMYRLGQIGGGSLQADLQSWWARVRGKEDPNTKIGDDQRSNGETFMALNGIDLTIHQGEAVGIIGSNGAGKSTLLKLLSKVTAPTDGEIDIYGRIASMLEVGTGFNGELTGRENVYMNGAILGMTKAEIDAKMEQIIDFSEVREFIDTPVKRYSSGMYVKLAFSVAAHLDSEIMIMDEVLAVGDMAFQKKCLSKMRDAAKVGGRTVIYVSHNMNTIRQLCDRCIVLDKGKVLYQGDVEKSIKYYMNNDDSKISTYYDFSNKPRYGDFGKEIKVISLKWLSNDSSTFNVNEYIYAKIKVFSNIDKDNVRIIMPIKDEYYSKIGMAYSLPFSIRKYEEKEIKIKIDLRILSAGTYCLSLGVIELGIEKRFFTYDDTGAKLMVELIGNDNLSIEWHNEFWGHCSFPDIEVVD